MKQSIQSQATFSFRFEGDSTIDTMLLIDTLKNFNELVSIASSERYFVDRVYGDVLRDSGQISMFDTHL